METPFEKNKDNLEEEEKQEETSTLFKIHTKICGKKNTIMWFKCYNKCFEYFVVVFIIYGILSFLFFLISSFGFAYYQNVCSEKICKHIDGNVAINVERVHNKEIIPEIYTFSKCTSSYQTCGNIKSYVSIFSQNNTIITSSFINQSYPIDDDDFQTSNQSYSSFRYSSSRKRVCFTTCTKTTVFYRSVWLVVNQNQKNIITHKYENQNCWNSSAITTSYKNESCLLMNHVKVGVNDNILYSCKLFQKISSDLNVIKKDISEKILSGINLTKYLKISYSNKCYYYRKNIHQNTQILNSFQKLFYLSLIIVAPCVFICLCFAYIVAAENKRKEKELIFI